MIFWHLKIELFKNIHSEFIIFIAIDNSEVFLGFW